MKNHRLIGIVAVFLFIISFSGKSSAQEITGGYGTADKNSSEVRSAARFAVAKKDKQTRRVIKFSSVTEAQAQVVSGLNYKICLKVRDGKKSRRATAIVYKNLRGRYSLTSWVWDKCEL